MPCWLYYYIEIKKSASILCAKDIKTPIIETISCIITYDKQCGDIVRYALD